MLLIAITVLLLAVTLVGAATSLANWRLVSNNEPLGPAEAVGRQQYMALIGIFVNVVFALGIVWAGLSLMIVNMCVRAR